MELTSGTIAALNILLTANTAQANAALAKTEAQLRGTAATATATSKTMGSRLATAGKAFAVFGVAAGAVLYKVGKDFDDAYDKIETTTGATGKHLKRLKDDFREVVSDVPADFDTASTAVADLSQRLDLTGKPLQHMAKQMTELSRMTGTDVSTNITSVSRAFRDWDVRARDMSKTLDGFFRLSQKTGVSVSDLTTYVQKFGSPLRQLGFTLDEAAAMFANFERSGVNIATMVPGLKLAISNLTRPTEELGATMEKLGINVGKPDVALQQIFKLLSGNALSTIDKTGLAMDVFGKRAGADMAEAIRQGRFEVEDLMKVMEDGQGTILKTGRKTWDLSEQFQRLTNNLELALEPVATRVFKTLGDEARKFTKILSDKDLTGAEKFEAIMDEIQRFASKYGPKIAEAGGKIGVALLKGIVDAFIHSSVLGKLFIAETFIRLIGGPGVLATLGTALGNPIGAAAAAALVTSLLLYLELKDHVISDAVEKMAFGKKDWFDSDAFSDWLGNVEQISKGELGKILTAWQATGNGITKDQILMWQREGKITSQGAVNLIATLERLQKHWRKAYGALADTTRHTGRDIKDVTGDMADRFDWWADRGGKDIRRLADAFDPLGAALRDTKQDVRDFVKDATKMFDRFIDKGKSVEEKVGDSFLGLASVVTHGLSIIIGETNKVLKGLGVKKIAISIAGAGAAASGAAGHQTGGVIVPGKGSGDKVPAMLEPGEVVWNREAVKAYFGSARRANRINSLIPRFATGGWVDPAGPGHGVVNPAIAGVVGNWSKRFDAAINYGYDPGGGHLSPGHNVTGTATDTGPAAGWGSGPTSLFEKGLKLLVGSGLTVLYGSHGVGTPYPNHGYGNHAHIEWGMHPQIKGLAGAVAEMIKRVLLKGPNGPLKDIGQSALDKVRSAANAYIKSKSGGFMGGDIGAPIRSLPDALQKYNRTYPRSSGLGDGYSLPFNVVAAIAEWAGSPGVSMARTAIGESQLEPGAVAHDPNGYSTGYGLQMITQGVGNDAMINALGGTKSLLNPVINEQAAAKILKSSGWGAWYSSTKDTSNTHYDGPLLRQRGGIIGLQKGGDPKKDGKPIHGAAHGMGTDPDFKRLRHVRRLMQRIAELIGEKGKAARLEETIGRVESLAGLESSPMGSELSPAELARQIALNEKLLETLTRARKLTGSGLRLANRKPYSEAGDKQFRGVRANLGQTMLDLAGLTGKGGRIFDAKLHLDELRHTTTGTGALAAMDISGLRSVIEAARYGVFDSQLPRFHEGGTYRAPAGRNEGAAILSDGERVSPPGAGVVVNNSFDFEGLDLIVTTTVNGEIAKRERLRHNRARQYQR